MGRAPCCEKTGLKKGPWSPEEDRILISYVQQHGHANWRALPKQAGLLRCGKSCRLRWINYLRPDIKRGNFTEEEEESIIQLHETLGNRWSAIAARLPGRTDNEIKNVWHTHLKKRLDKRNQDKSNDIKDRKQSTNTLTKCDSNNSIVTTTSSNSNTTTTQSESENSSNNFPPRPTSSNLSSISSPRPSSSEVSSLGNSSGDMTINHSDVKSERIDNYNGENSVENSFLEIDDTFWSEALSAENAVTSLTSKETNEMDMILGNLPEIDQSFWSDELSSSSTVENNNCSSSMPLDFGGVNFADQLQTESPPFISIDDYMVEPSLVHGGSDYPQVGDDNGMDFWYDVFVNSSGESIQPLF